MSTGSRASTFLVAQLSPRRFAGRRAAACAPDTDLTGGAPGRRPPAGRAARRGRSSIRPRAPTDVPVEPGGRASFASRAGRSGAAPASGSATAPRAPCRSRSPRRRVACDGSASATASALTGALPAGAPVQVALGAGNEDAVGGAAARGRDRGLRHRGRAATRAARARRSHRSTAAGACLRSRFATDEPARGRSWSVRGGRRGSSGRPAWANRVRRGRSPCRTAARRPRDASWSAPSIARATSPPRRRCRFRPRRPCPPIAITEVLANAAGPEPAQEYVELRNLGERAVDRSAGCVSRTRKVGRVSRPRRLPPGAYALVVPSGYDPAAGQDRRRAPGPLLLRVDARLGRGRPRERRRAGPPAARRGGRVELWRLGRRVGERLGGQGCPPPGPDRLRSRGRLEPHALAATPGAGPAVRNPP